MNITEFIINNTVGNLYWKDKDGRYLGCNKAYSDMIGLNSPSEIVEKTDRDLYLSVMGEEKLRIIEETDQRIMKLKREEVLEEEGVGENGKKAFYLTKKIPLINSENEIVGIMGTSIDITKEKKAELAHKLFLENIAHDIRTPFSGIYSIIEMLSQKNIFDEETKELLTYVMMSAKSLLDFLNEILEIIALGSEPPIKISYFPIKIIINNVINLMISEIKRKGLEVEVDCPSTFVSSDRPRIHRILTNLIGNAVKFTDKGKITVKVKTDPLEISVMDTGIGIPEDKLEIIFNRFTKVTPSYTASDFVGAGVGLYLARLIARELGGDIEVESKPNVGSNFRFFLTNLKSF